MQISLNFTAVAVTALEGGHHGGDGEGQQEEPDDDRDLRRFLHYLDKVPPPEMHHVEVAIDGEGDEEGDTGSPVEEQHEEHGFAEHVVLAAPQLVAVVVGLGRKADHQQEVCNHNIEQEDTFVLPELEPKEEVNHRTIICSASRTNRRTDTVMLTL